jgi:hypothetical protein
MIVFVFAARNAAEAGAGGRWRFLCARCEMPFEAPAPTFADGRVLAVAAFYCSPACAAAAIKLDTPADA